MNSWKVGVSKRAAKRLKKLPRFVQERFDILAKELEVAGPIRSNWPHFGRLKTRDGLFQYHCHIKQGRPTFVACREVVDFEIRLIEVYYAGSHEDAPY